VYFKINKRETPVGSARDSSMDCYILLCVDDAHVFFSPSLDDAQPILQTVSPPGVRWMHLQLDCCLVHGITFTPDKGDETCTARNETISRYLHLHLPLLASSCSLATIPSIAWVKSTTLRYLLLIGRLRRSHRPSLRRAIGMRSSADTQFVRSAEPELLW